MSTSSIYLAQPDGSLFTLGEVCERCSVHAEMVIEMVEYGVVTPIDIQASNDSWRFTIDCLSRVTRALRLRQDLELNLAGLALSLELLDQIDALQREIKALKHQLLIEN